MKIVNVEDLKENFFEYEELENEEVVERILNQVREEGDSAVKKYTQKFDNLQVEELEVSEREVENAFKKVEEESVKALREAAESIRFFAKTQLNSIKEFETEKNNVILGQKIIPLNKVGCYVPGGRYPLPSSALMSVIPAKVAGVKRVILCSPRIKPVTIVAASIAGVDRIFNIGGVQAIGAMTYGTETVPEVDKIVGPGNKYVVAAKKKVYGRVGIDFLAGPSEVLVIADDSGKSELIAADLLAQAEHDPEAQPNLISTSELLARRVNKELMKQLRSLGTKEVIKSALNNGRIILVNSLKEAVRLSNKKAPEHLELQVENPEEYLKELTNYGSLFLGEYSAEVYGDYCTGPNHTLPTNFSAKYTGGLSVKDFVKTLTYQRVKKEGVNDLIRTSSRLARIEGLEGHKNASNKRSYLKS